MPQPDSTLYAHLKAQHKLLERQIVLLQDLKRQTENDILKVEEQVKERTQTSLFN